MVPFHCARSEGACKKCQQLAEEGEKYCLISFQSSPQEMARPIMTIEIDGEDVLFEFYLKKVFKDKNQAKEYAIRNNIEMP